MVYNKFLLFLLIRVSLISLCSLGMVWAFYEPERIFTGILLAVLFIFQIAYLFRFVSKTNRDLSKFLLFMSKRDTSLEFSTYQLEKIFKDLGKSYTSIIEDINKIKIEKEEKEQLFQTVINNVSTGILSFNKNGEIRIFNEAAKELLNTDYLINIKDLNNKNKELFNSIQTLEAGMTAIFKIEFEGNIKQLSLSCTVSRTAHEELKMISIQDIRNELEENELQSYQRLIRVMTHEMLNSLTPITTLTTSIKRSFTENNKLKTLKKIDPESIEDAVTSSELIEERSKGLIDFIQKYRSLTKLPQPIIKEQTIQEIIENTSNLLSVELKQNKISLSIKLIPETLKIELDSHLIEQVLINLLKNAIEALKDNKNGEIKISAFANDNGQKKIEISDNGPGIDPKIMDELFIPFFTTKENGSGIGLSLCRQIMRLHGGSIKVESMVGEGSTFTLEF